jgi:hypothetical protein
MQCCVFGPCGDTDSSGGLGPVVPWATQQATQISGSFGDQYHQFISPGTSSNAAPQLCYTCVQVFHSDTVLQTRRWRCLHMALDCCAIGRWSPPKMRPTRFRYAYHHVGLHLAFYPFKTPIVSFLRRGLTYINSRGQTACLGTRP